MAFDQVQQEVMLDIKQGQARLGVYLWVKVNTEPAPGIFRQPRLRYFHRSANGLSPGIIRPLRRLWRTDDARIRPRPLAELDHLGRAEREIEAPEILRKPLALGCAQDRNDLFLLKEAQRHL